jgi:hypothetical protein
MEVPESLPAGTYPAQFGGVEDGGEQQFGPTLIWTFYANTGVSQTGEPVWQKIDAMSSLKFTPRAKGAQWVAALIGRPLGRGEDFDLDSIPKGTPCLIAVEENPDSGFSKIVGVFPAPQTPATPIANTRAQIAAEAPFVPTSATADTGWTPPEEIPF